MKIKLTVEIEVEGDLSDEQIDDFAESIAVQLDPDEPFSEPFWAEVREGSPVKQSVTGVRINRTPS